MLNLKISDIGSTAVLINKIDAGIFPSCIHRPEPVFTGIVSFLCKQKVMPSESFSRYFDHINNSSHCGFNEHALLDVAGVATDVRYHSLSELVLRSNPAASPFFAKCQNTVVSFKTVKEVKPKLKMASYLKHPSNKNLKCSDRFLHNPRTAEEGENLFIRGCFMA